MGWESNVFPLLIAGNTIVINASGEFVYNGAPALGNLIASIANSNGVDAFGNRYYNGIISYNPSGGAIATTVAELTAGGIRIGTGNAASGIGGASAGSITSNNTGSIQINTGAVNGTDVQNAVTFQSADASGIGVPNTIIGAGALTMLDSSIVPTPALGASELYVTSNSVYAEATGSGFIGELPIDQTDTSDNVNANNGTQGLTIQYTIPANDAAIGTTYEIEVPFNGVLEASGLAFKPALNTASVVTSLGDGVAGGFLGAGTGVTGWVKLIARIKTLGVAGTVDYFIEGGIGQNALHSSNSEVLSSQSTGMPINTTVSNTLRVNSVWSAAVAGQTVSGHGSVFTRKGP